ncbi:hypothetical protein EDD86DRAFT_246169 [Gorgonomyces haynaldii]|nr:hypothetical protein EDD86DRAFT_246169 [Gorgonomyces haynaldii]
MTMKFEINRLVPTYSVFHGSFNVRYIHFLTFQEHQTIVGEINFGGRQRWMKPVLLLSIVLFFGSLCGSFVLKLIKVDYQLHDTLFFAFLSVTALSAICLGASSLVCNSEVRKRLQDLNQVYLTRHIQFELEDLTEIKAQGWFARRSRRFGPHIIIYAVGPLAEHLQRQSVA